eukprot:gene15340-10968_t
MAKRTADDDLLGMFSSMNMTSTAKREAVISKATKKSVEAKTCPVELMSQFLLLITENKMKEALLLTNQILEHEPKNKMVLEYKTYLRQYIQQGPATSAPKGSAASTSSTARRGREEAKGSGRPRDAKEVLTR